jgi:hypothetical protein
LVSAPSELLPQFSFVLCYTKWEFGEAGSLEQISRCDFLPA